MIISMIAAIGERNRVVGRDNGLPWSKRLKPDMDRFVSITKGHPVIMGRHTWDSIPERFRPLPDRTNIVVTKTQGLQVPGAIVAHSVHAALGLAEDYTKDEIFVIGGQQVYQFAKPKAQRLYLTLVDEDALGDTFFPEYSEFSKEIERVVVADFSPRLTFLTLERP